MQLDRKAVLTAGLLVEGSLVLIFVVWSFFRDFQWTFFPSLEQVFWGVILTIPMLVVNLYLLGLLSRKIPLLRTIDDFVEQVVRPIADTLDPASALIVSISAGIGEELFFRGVLQTEFGLLAASILFSLLHFGPAVKDYIVVAILYALIGAYLGCLYIYFDTLWVPIIVHFLYDYIALIFLRYVRV